jgi:hypothetical protein
MEAHIETLANNPAYEGEIGFTPAVAYHPNKPDLLMDVAMPMGWWITGKPRSCIAL